MSYQHISNLRFQKTLCHICITLFFVFTMCSVKAYPVDALLELSERSISSTRSFTASSLIVGKENERLRVASKNLPTTRKGLREILDGGGPEKGVVAEGEFQACTLETNQGRQISILKASSGTRLFTDISGNGDNIQVFTSFVFGRSDAPPSELLYLSLKKYPINLVRASGGGTVFIIDEAKANEAEKVIDLAALCETEKDIQAQSVAQVDAAAYEKEQKRFEGNAFRPVQSELNSPYDRFPSSNGLVYIKYDAIEVTLQAVAVALFLLELLILADLKKRPCRYYHFGALAFLLVAASVSTGMGCWKVSSVLKEQNFAWESCGSYNMQPTMENSTRQGFLYEAHCEWVVIRATSDWQAYLILLPSSLGLFLLFLLLAKFAVYKAGWKGRTLTKDDKGDELDEFGAGSSSSESYREGKQTHVPRVLNTGVVLLAMLFATASSMDTCSVKGFPPETAIQLGMDTVFDNPPLAIFIGGVASSGTWRCAWESGPKGTEKDITSCAKIDDCVVRWTAPTEDPASGFLTGRTEVTHARCTIDSICPFTGRKCTQALNDTFGCNARFKFPPPITYLSPEDIRKSEKRCTHGTPLKKAFCKAYWMNNLAKKELKSIVLQIKDKLGDTPVNAERLSAYEFPDCAGPPLHLRGIQGGLGAESWHPSSRGANCVNSEELKARARRTSRTFCVKRLLEEKICVVGKSKYRDRKRGSRFSCPRKLIDLCADTAYKILLIKSKTLRATDDWMVSRCHQAGMTAFGRPRNWTMNDDDALLLEKDQVPRNKQGFPLVRPVRIGWRFRGSDEFRFPPRPTLKED